MYLDEFERKKYNDIFVNEKVKSIISVYIDRCDCDEGVEINFESGKNLIICAPHGYMEIWDPEMQYESDDSADDSYPDDFYSDDNTNNDDSYYSDDE